MDLYQPQVDQLKAGEEPGHLLPGAQGLRRVRQRYDLPHYPGRTVSLTLTTLATLITWGNVEVTLPIPPVGRYHPAEKETVRVRGGASFAVPPALNL
jgi:hypothetical protein